MFYDCLEQILSSNMLTDMLKMSILTKLSSGYSSVVITGLDTRGQSLHIIEMICCTLSGLQLYFDCFHSSVFIP